MISTSDSDSCIICYRVDAHWIVRLPLADRSIHMGCGQKWLANRRIFPSQTLVAKWLERGPDWRELLWMTQIPRVFKVAKEVIPPGFWPLGQVGNGSGGSNRQRKEDPHRVAFFRTRAVLEGDVEGALGVRQPPYRGFVLRAASGQRVLFMENPMEENAIYVFFFDQPDCLTHILLSKWKLRTGDCESFFGYIIHHSGWQERILQLLANL